MSHKSKIRIPDLLDKNARKKLLQPDEILQLDNQIAQKNRKEKDTVIIGDVKAPIHLPAQIGISQYGGGGGGCPWS